MFKKSRLYMAALVAFLVGVPLAESASAGVGSIVSSSLDLGLGIAELAIKGS